MSIFWELNLDTLKANYEITPGYKLRSIPEKTGPTFFTTMFVSSCLLNMTGSLDRYDSSLGPN